MSKYYLAVDIGASSGRHILGSVQDGKIVLEEIYRFENGMKKVDGHLCWDHVSLFENIKAGMKKCKEVGKIPVSMGIDTWGVDYALLDENDQLIDKLYGYRDSRTNGMDDEVYKVIPERELYARTGSMKAMFNTIYQVMADKVHHPESVEKAKTLLFVPDYFNFLLTGKKANEYTEASTSQLLNPWTKQWDYELMDMLGLKKEIFQEIIQPGTSLGNLRPEVAEEIGFDLELVVPCTHDTGSAVLAVPANDDDFIFISSGTWSLMGIEVDKADSSDVSYKNNFTNEGCYGGRVRYLKNIMGLWIIQSVRHNLDDKYSFAEICSEAAKNAEFPSRIDVNNDVFMAPDNMIEAIKKYCADTNQPVPETLGEIATVVYASLAECYAETIKGIEEFAGRTFSRIHVVGGGSNAGYLNELTAKATGKEVHCGPGEATAIGNLLAQMLKTGEYVSKEEAREAVHKSFDVKVY